MLGKLRFQTLYKLREAFTMPTAGPDTPHY